MINRHYQPERDDDLATQPHLQVIAPQTLRRYPRRIWLDRVGSVVVAVLLSGFALLLLWILLGGR